MSSSDTQSKRLGTLTRILRFPVKSMRGEEVESAELTMDGVAHDRLFAFETNAAPPSMLRVSGTERPRLLRFQARHTPVGVVVTTPSGENYNVSNPELIARMDGFSGLRLTCESTPQTDCRPLSIISLQTIDFLSRELGKQLDPLQFRANLYLDMPEPFAEDYLVGQSLRIGTTACIHILERDPRCRFITFNPSTYESTPKLMTILHRHHQSRAGVYARIMRPGFMHVGDILQSD